MTIPNRNHRKLSLLLVLALGLLAGQALADTSVTKDLIADLKKAVAAPAGTPANPAFATTARYIDQVEIFLAQGRYAEVEQGLAQLRTNLPAGNEQLAGLFEQLLVNVRAEMSAAAAKQEAACNAIEADFVAKFNGKAPAADYDALLKRLAALTPVTASNYSNPNAQKVEQLRSFIARWQDYLLQTARGNNEQATQALSELVQQSNRLPIIPRSQLANLLAEASGRVGGRNEAAEARVAALQKQLVTLIDSAKGAADFDALIVELAKPLQIDGVVVRGGSYGGQLDNLRRFATRWQDYFSQVEAGNTQNALNLLREFSTNNNYDALYPRSRVLARLNSNVLSAPPAKAMEPLIPPKELTVDKLDQLFNQLQLRQSTNVPLPAGLDDLPVELGYLRTALAALSGAAPGSVIIDARNAGRAIGRVGTYAEVFATIKAEIMLRAFTQYLDAPAAEPPTRNESFDSYSKRLVEHGRAQKDWPLVYRVLIARQNLAPGTSANNPDVVGYKIFITGTQQETAGLWSMAVHSYFNALNAGSLLLPVEEIAGRLKRLKAEHPEEYASTPYTLFIGNTPLTPGQAVDAPPNYPPAGSRPLPAPPIPKPAK